MVVLSCICRKYEWIVKGGEEVRIDQRIEQLFDVMNGLMQRQPGAAEHSLQVCPCTPTPPALLYCLPMLVASSVKYPVAGQHKSPLCRVCLKTQTSNGLGTPFDLEVIFPAGAHSPHLTTGSCTF